MTIFPKGPTVYKTNLCVEFAIYNVTSIDEFTSMLTIACAKTIMLCILPTEYKQAHICNIRFILTTSKNKQHSCKCVRVDEDGVLEKSTYINNLLVDDFSMSMETNGGDASWLNGNN